ncbi:hypothetical protein, partial [Candidatus Ichthyocystis sparus]|uniref:hypothetical protein n=2 Tax=Candidatus Ichthyocystis sparus TaxID=1561004 RepID=UPI00159EC5FE
AIWYFTYRLMCEYSFVSRCFGEYHHKHRPGFIRALPDIRVLSERNVVPLPRDRLLDFLSKLDCAVHNKVKSIFDSRWSEVSVTLEEGSLNSVSCKDFIDVLEVANIPPLASLVLLGAKPTGSKSRAISKGRGGCSASGVSVIDPTHSSPSAFQPLPPQSHPERTRSQSDSQLGSSLSLGDSSSAPSESVKCVDLLGVKLHPDSAELICSVFCKVRSSARRSFSISMLNYISTIMISELSALEKAIWAKTYRKLYLSRFMSRVICVYHSRCYTNFIRALDSIRVLSSSSDRSLVTLSGVGLLGFLSRLDCAVRGEVEIVFNSEWGKVTGKVFSELEDESMSTVSCENFIRVLDIVGVPVVALSVSQRYDTMRKRRKRAISKMEKLRSGNECAVEVTEPGSSSTTTTAVDKEVDAERGRGRFYAQKSAVALDCASLCAMVFPECALMIKALFSKVGALARSIYEDMVSKQLPQEISDKLSVTERAIWYRTYTATCEVSFVSRCFGEYHAKHRPDFVRSISKIQVLSDAKGNLLDFLLSLDCAIRREMESVFSSCWSEVSVSLEGESLSAINCRDFVKVLDVAGILAMALSTNVGISTKGRGGKGKGVAPVIGVVDLTHSSPPSPRSLPSQSGGSQLGSSLPLGETSSALTELTLLSSSVGDSVGESSSGLIVAKRHKGSDSVGSDSVPVSTYSEAGTVCTTAVGVLPVSTKASTSTASAVSISSSCASLSVQYVDLLDVRLHPDSAKLICDLFSVIRRSARTSYSMTLKRLLRAVSSELSAVGQAIWCRTYRELHLLSFMARCLCLYHHRYRPDFIRSLAGIRVLSSSSDRNAVPLSGGELLSFLSKLDCAIREEVGSIFSLEWDRVADSVFAELEDGSLSDVGCEDFVNIFDAVSVPVVAFSISQEYEKKHVINKSKKSGSAACSLDASLQQVRPKSKPKTKQKFKPQSSLPLVQRGSLPKHHLLSGTRLGSLLLLEEDSSQSSLKFVKSLYYRDRDQSGNVSAAVSTFVVPPEGTESSLPPSESVVAADVSFASVTAVATFSDVSDSENAGSSREAEEGYIQGSIAGGNLQQVLVPRDTTSDAAISDVVTALGNGVSTRGRGKASAKKGAASAAVSYLATTLNPNILSSLGVVLSPESVQVIAGLFYEVGEFARRVYEGMIRKQLPSIMSGKFSMTGLAIWYHTYSSMCKYFFVSRCLGEYHANHRPGFIRTLPSIQVVSDFSGHAAVTLTGDALLGFLSRLDCAIRSEVESIFDSCLSEVSVPLEEESLSAINCRDLVDVMSVAGISQVELSVMLLSSAENSRGGTSSDPIAAEGHAYDGVAVPHTSELGLLSSAENSRGGPSPDLISAEDDTPSSSAVSIPSYLECASSLGVELHPDSVPLIHSFFRRVHLYVVTSFLRSVRSYISTAIGSGLSVVGRSVWFETYRELNLYNFISGCLGSYHYNYRPDFVRDLSNIRVLSDSSDLGLQLSGGSLVDFLSRLDYVVHDLISCVFNSQWGVEVDRACSELEDGSLDNVSCEDLIYVLNTAGVPELALSVYQRRREGVKRRREGIKRRRKGIPGSSSKITSKGKASSGGVTGVDVQPQPELLLQPQPELLLQPQPELLPSSDLQSGVSSGSLSPLIPESSFECEQLPIFAPFLQHHWLEKLD